MGNRHVPYVRSAICDPICGVVLRQLLYTPETTVIRWFIVFGSPFVLLSFLPEFLEKSLFNCQTPVLVELIGAWGILISNFVNRWRRIIYLINANVRASPKDFIT